MCDMSNSIKIFWTSNELSQRWELHRASVPRLMARFGCSGLKFGTAQQAARRFSAADVKLVEHLAGLGAAGNQETQTTAQ